MDRDKKPMTEAEQLINMADMESIAVCLAMWKKWTSDTVSLDRVDSSFKAMLLQVYNAGRLRGENSCMFAHPDMASPGHELVLREKGK